MARQNRSGKWLRSPHITPSQGHLTQTTYPPPTHTLHTHAHTRTRTHTHTHTRTHTHTHTHHSLPCPTYSEAVALGCIPPLCSFLSAHDAMAATVALEALSNILKVGQMEVRNPGGLNPYSMAIEEAGGVFWLQIDCCLFVDAQNV